MKMLSSGANCIIWDWMLSSGMKRYHLELMLSSGTTCYQLGLHVIIWDAMLSSGANVIIWDKMLSSGANVIMVSSWANVIIWCYHVMLSSGMITHPFFIFPKNFTHSAAAFTWLSKIWISQLSSVFLPILGPLLVQGFILNFLWMQFV